MKRLKLTKNQHALVDEEDFEYLSQWRWCYGAKGYAYRGAGTTTSPRIYLHKLILNAPKDKKVDHINHDSLDNRKSNLRVCSHVENLMNQRIRNDTKSGYKGVHRVTKSKTGKYWAYITVHKKHKYLGVYPTREEAALAYNKAAMKYHGEFALLNSVLIK